MPRIFFSFKAQNIFKLIIYSFANNEISTVVNVLKFNPDSANFYLPMKFFLDFA